MSTNKNHLGYSLWFDHQAEEAARFYTSVFSDATIGEITYYGKEGHEIHHQKEGTVLTASFTLHGQEFMGLNGGPVFKINPSISFYVICETEAEIDQLWQSLSEKGKALMALQSYPWSKKYGWVEDRFGLSWQLSLGKVEQVGQKISPLLMYPHETPGKTREAIRFYTDVFRNTEIIDTVEYEKGEPGYEGNIKHAEFALEGQIFMAMDSGVKQPFTFNEGVSILIKCHSQREIDYYWERLTEGGDPKAQQCGWLKDKFGVSWQVYPVRLEEMLRDPDKAKTERVTKAYLQMKKFDLAELEKAFEGKE